MGALMALLVPAAATAQLPLPLPGPPTDRRAPRPALRHQRRRRLPQRAAARRGGRRQRRRSSRASQATGSAPAHWADQQPLYDGLLVRVADAHARPDRPTTTRTRRSACADGDVESTESPRAGRDDRARQGLRRPAHLRRHARRRRCSAPATRARRTACSSWTSCATPAARSCPRSPAARAGNREMDRTQWALAPYTEADLQRQIDHAPAALRRRAAQQVAAGRQRITSHGINAYIDAAQLDPTKLPAEYAAFGKTPDPWTLTDVDRRRRR